MNFKLLECIDGEGIELRADNVFQCSSGSMVKLPDRITTGWLENAFDTAYQMGRQDKAKEIREQLGIRQ